MKKGKKYTQALSNIDSQTLYELDEAIALCKKTATTKFDSTVEVHLKLGIDPRKGDQQIRSTVTLPHVFGKKKRIAVFAEPADQKAATDAGAAIVGGEELIQEIKSSGKVDFDIAIATPEMMKPLALIAKILGPKGLMPSPKAETVTSNIANAIEELSKGKMTFKNDSTANVHAPVGKVSMEDAQIKENIIAFLEAVKNVKPETSKGTYLKSLTLTTTMGPGIACKTAV